MSKKLQIKEQLKNLAKQVCEAKAQFVTRQRAFSLGTEKIVGEQYTCPIKAFYTALNNKEKLQEDFRYQHIARCLLMGRDYKKIENKTKPGNEPDGQSVNHYIEYFCAYLGLSHCPVYALQSIGEDNWTLGKVEEKVVHENLKDLDIQELAS